MQERDTQGRVHDVLVIGDWLVTYWPDHAAHELRIVRPLLRGMRTERGGA